MAGKSVERREVVYSGHVQGVGFRYQTRAVAARYAVGGYVRNLPDGCVQLVAEATPSELNRFLDDLADQMSDYISDAVVDTQAATGEFASFEIRY